MHRSFHALLLLALSLTPCLSQPPVLAQAETAETQAKMVLVATQDLRFNEFLLRGLQGELKSYETESAGVLQGDFKTLFSAIRARASEFEGRADEEVLALEGQSLTVAQARKISQAQTILVPTWEFSPIELVGPLNLGGQWQLSTESTLKLSLQVYEGNMTTPKEINGSWRIKKALPIANIDAIVAVVQQATGEKPDPNTAEGREKINQALSQIEAFKQLLATDPAGIMAEVAELHLQTVSMESIANKIEVPATETKPTPLPKHSGQGLGMNIGLRAGTTSLGFWGLAPQYFIPMGELVVDYDIGQYFNFPEFFISASGGATIPQAAFAFTQPSFGLGMPTTTLTLNPQDSLFSFSAELGLTKKFNLHPWLLSITARGGMLGGMIFESFPTNQFGVPSYPMAMAFGGTVLAGAQYKITPNFMVGLDAGFRYFDQGYFATNQGFGPQPYPQTQSTFFQGIGPVINLYTGINF